jgi:hypothetical protein
MAFSSSSDIFTLLLNLMSADREIRQSSLTYCALVWRKCHPRGAAAEGMAQLCGCALRVAETCGSPRPVSRMIEGAACGDAFANKGHDTRTIQGWLSHRSVRAEMFRCIGLADLLSPVRSAI